MKLAKMLFFSIPNSFQTFLVHSTSRFKSLKITLNRNTVMVMSETLTICSLTLSRRLKKRIFGGNVHYKPEYYEKKALGIREFILLQVLGLDTAKIM